MLEHTIQFSGRAAQVDSVIANGYCIGCGACAAWPDTPYSIAMNRFGAYQAQRTDRNGKVDTIDSVDRICPFSDSADNEDTIAGDLFGGGGGAPHPKLGYCMAAYAGHANDGNFRERGSSGGMGSWLADALLAKNHVDAIVHVMAKNSGTGEPLFQYGISWDRGALHKGAKSRYYPITLASVLDTIRIRPARYAFVGLPCFIKAIRLTARQDQAFAKSVACCIGLVCGHLKSQSFAECLAWQLGIPPNGLESIDFRKKLPNRGANRYGVEVTGNVSGRQVTHVAPVHQLFGCDWGMGLFKPKACDYCDDVMAETADVTVGDAWLPQYVGDSGGTNILVVRRPDVVSLLEEARSTGKVMLDDLSPDEVAQSQASGFAHRREGLACRLWLADSESCWRPRKRIVATPSAPESVLYRRQKLRIALGETSHEAFLEAKRRGDLTYFLNRLVPLGQSYLDITRPPLRRLVARLRSFARTRIGATAR